MPEQNDQAIKARLREEYFDLLPQIHRVTAHLETEIRYRTLPIFHRLKHYEQLVVKSRVKECESALKTLRRDQEGGVFDPDRPGDYSILNLPDLAGVRVLVFPHARLVEVDEALRTHFSGWTSKPVKDAGGVPFAPKFFGYCKDENDNTISNVRGEYQVVPMLIGLFWEVEHSALYKPAPSLKGIGESAEMTKLKARVELALSQFEEEFESFVLKNTQPPAF